MHTQSQENQKNISSKKKKRPPLVTLFFLYKNEQWKNIFFSCVFFRWHSGSQGCSLSTLTSLLTTSGLAWVHLVTFLCADDVVRPEEGVIDLDWHKQPVPCLACHTASLGHCSMPECQMRRDGEHTGWWPAHHDAGHSFGKAGTHLDKKGRFHKRAQLTV